MSSPTASNVRLRLAHSLCEDGEYDVFSNVSVDTLLSFTDREVGFIKAVIIEREKIPDDCFLSTMDGHSSDLQLIGSTVYEPRFGRPKLQSLKGYDSMEFDIMYIKKFHVDDEFKRGGASDVATSALYQLLHHPLIKGDYDYGCWKVSSAVYIVDAEETMGAEERTAFAAKVEAERRA
jgi:hypothetical protein